eukprot:333620-Rhodomonas_salina.1
MCIRDRRASSPGQTPRAQTPHLEALGAPGENSCLAAARLAGDVHVLALLPDGGEEGVEGLGVGLEARALRLHAPLHALPPHLLLEVGPPVRGLVGLVLGAPRRHHRRVLLLRRPLRLPVLDLGEAAGRELPARKPGLDGALDVGLDLVAEGL